MHCVGGVFFFQAEDGIRDLVRSRGLGDVYKRQGEILPEALAASLGEMLAAPPHDDTSLTRRVGIPLSLIHI